MSNENISFENSSGKQLSAKLELPADREPHNYAIFAHCFTCNKNFTAVRYISAALAAEGFGVLSFDFTGLGMSEGDFSETNFSGSVEDLIAAATFLRENHRAPTLMIGHSLGGAASLLAAAEIEEVKAVATIGTPCAPQHVTKLLAGGIEEIEEKGAASINIGGRDFTIKKQFVEDLKDQNLLNAVRRMRKAFLFLHSPQDEIVGIENAADLYGAAFHPKSFVSLDGADHLLSQTKDARYAGDLIAAWAARYIEIPEEKELATEKHIVAYLGGEQKFTTEIKAGRHHLTADEPVSFGGDDFGASPYALVASGLAACTAMTLRLYADRKKWDLREVYVHISHEKTHLEDCLKCETADDGKIDHFAREIEMIGDLDAEQKARLLEIADKCPVHKTLEAGTHISTKMVDG